MTSLIFGANMLEMLEMFASGDLQCSINAVVAAEPPWMRIN